MKKITVVLILLITQLSLAQIGIGNTNPQSTLDISTSNATTPSNTDGILIPRIDNFPVTNPTASQDGMMVFYTGTAASGKGFYYWNQTTTSWIAIGSGNKNTLDQAYDEGGAGVGRTITADNGAVEIISDANGSNALHLSQTGANNSTSLLIENSAEGINQGIVVNSSQGIGTMTAGTFNATAVLNAATVTGIKAIATSITDTATGIEAQASGSTNVNYGIKSTAFGTGAENWAGYFGDGTYLSGTGNVFVNDDLITEGTFKYRPNGNPVTTGLVLVTAAADGLIDAVNPSTLFTDTNTQNTLDQAYDQGGAGVGRTITADNGALLINGTDGFMTTGTVGSGTILTNPSGLSLAYMYFYPKKAAFRAGVNVYSWSGDGPIGNYSTASGHSNLAVGDYSTAFGFNNSTNGNSGTAFGRNNSASGENSTAFGNDNSANGQNSVATGLETSAWSFSEVSMGMYNNTTTANSATAFDASDQIFSIGNGTMDTNRSNALTIYKSGLMNINDAYNMPLTDGTANQVMTTDGSGNVSWANATGSSNTTSNGLTLTGSDIQLGGTLNQYTTINHGNNNLGFDLTGTGDFIVLDNGTIEFIVEDSGDVGIGTNNPNYLLDVNETDNSEVIAVNIQKTDNTATLNTSAMRVTKNAAGSGSSSVISTFADGTGYGEQRGVYNILNGTGTGNKFGIKNELTSASVGLQYGMQSNFSGATSSPRYAVSNHFTAGTGGQTGVYNNFDNNTSNADTAMLSIFYNTNTSPKTGVANSFALNSGGNHVGFSNSFAGNSDTEKIGLYSNFNSVTRGTLYGAKVDMNSTGAGTKYGIYVDFNAAVTGTNNYGVYSSVNQSIGWAGYFLGRLSIGTTTANNYILPASRGTNGQVMTTDGAGNVSFTTMAGENTTASNGLSETGNDVRLGGNLIQNTTINQDNNDMIFNLNGNGDFRVNASATQKLVVLDNGDTVLGGDLYMRDENTGGPVLGRIIDINGDDGALDLYNSNVLSTRINGGGDSYLTGGNLGIGTTTPDYNLSVTGTLNLREDLGAGPALRVNGTEALWFDGTYFSWGFGGAANFFSDDVGIGINAPAYKLDVRDNNATDYVAQIFNTSTNVNADGLKIRVGNALAPTANARFLGFFDGNDIIRGRVEGNGIGVTYNTASDRRLKTNIANIDNALNLIDKIQPRLYEYKANLGTQEYGFIAQELQPLYPQAVSGTPDSDVEKEPMMVDYGRLTPLLTAGIIELKKEVDTLKEENKKLKTLLSKYETLEARLSALENSTKKVQEAILASKN